MFCYVAKSFQIFQNIQSKFSMKYLVIKNNRGFDMILAIYDTSLSHSNILVTCSLFGVLILDRL